MRRVANVWHMAPMTLERPAHGSAESTRPDVVGNDGLTDAERDDRALTYLAGPGRRKLSSDEKRDIDAWLRARRA